MEVNICKTKLILAIGDIATAGTDAIANSANDRLWMGGGVAGAIKKAGGESIETEAMKKGPIPLGEVAVTSAGKIPAKYIIHTAVMGQDMQTKPEYIKAGTKNTISTAEKLPVESLAMPAFGTGVGHFPAEECAEIMITETVESLLSAKRLRIVKIVLTDKGTYEIFKKTLEKRFRVRSK